MNKSGLLPAMVVSVALLLSSIILLIGMIKLGEKIEFVGLAARHSEVELRNANNLPLRIILDDKSALKMSPSQASNEK
ncbi:MAG: hypothetical protein JW719_11215 [Pirellulales bacterium]|nr:hypothetical protein [Pirellulales bacterium]